MRIALISNLLPPEGRGGAELYVEGIARELAARHEVIVLSGTPGALESVETVVLPALPLLSADDPIRRKALWHLRDQWLSRVRSSAAQALRAFGPDVVFSHEPQGLSASVFAAIADGGFRHVHMTHDFNLLCARVTMTSNGERCGGRCGPCLLQRSIRLRSLRRRIDRVVAPSEMIRARHVAAGIPAHQVVTIRHGAHNGHPGAPSGNDTKTLGFIGALGAHKGVLTLLDAFQNTPSNWRLAVAGSGPMEEAVSERARLDERIRYCGFVTGSEKEAFFHTLDVLVVPSECEEVAPLVVVEAAVRAIPIIVSDRGGLPEAPAAEIFRAGDPVALRDAITRLLEEPGRLQSEKETLRYRHGEFAWERHVGEIEGLLTEVAGTS